MRYGKYAFVAVFLTVVVATPTWGATSIADGNWNDPGTWEGDGIPDQAANGGNGEDVFVNSNIVVPAGVDFVSTTTIDANGEPADGNLFMFFNTSAPLGSSLTLQSGAGVGSKFWTQVVGGNTAVVHVESGGEFVTAGINNGESTFTVNVQPGGRLTFDGSIHPNFPDEGFYRGNVFADGENGAANVFNIKGQLDVAHIGNANVGNNTYHLINGGVINEVPYPGQAIGTSSGNPRPPGSIGYDFISVSGTGNRILNAFGGASISQVPTGLTVDIADQTVFDYDDFSGDWAGWVVASGGDPTTVAGPRRAEINSESFSGTGIIQMDVYGFAVNDQGTPDPSDDTLGGVFHDQLYNGPGAAANSTFSGNFELGYVGSEISDSLVDLANSSQPALLLINGATNGSFFDDLAGMPVPDQVWNDGTRQYNVTFSDTFFFDLGDPFPPGMADTRLLFTTLESITPIAGPSLPGDFDNDGIVDGHDFLAWQRNPGVGSLTDWETNFGATQLAAASIAVPEPSSLILLGAMSVALAAAGRRRLS